MAVTRVHHVANPVTVPVALSSGQFLTFRVRAGGPIPRFRFSTDIKGILLNQGTFPQDPATLYEWNYLRDPSDVQQFEIVDIALLFAGNANYRVQVAVDDQSGKIRDVLDIEYTGGPADFDNESFRILIV